MRCPYITKSVTTQQVAAKEHVASDENVHVCWEVTEFTIQTPTECLKENCGVWIDGRCMYNQVEEEE